MRKNVLNIIEKIKVSSLSSAFVTALPHPVSAISPIVIVSITNVE